MRQNILPGAVILLASSWIGIANAGNILFSVEEPLADAVMAGISNIRGWAVSNVGIDYVELSINGKPPLQIPYGGTRKDVGNAYPGYPDSAHSGFSMAYAYALLGTGENNFTLTAVDNEGDRKTITRSFTVAVFQKSYFPETAPLSMRGSIALPQGDDVILTNVDMLGEKFGVVMGWDREKQNISIKDTVPADYSSRTHDGSWVGQTISDTLTTASGAVCGGTYMEMTLALGNVSGYAEDVLGNSYPIIGAVYGSGLLSGGFGAGISEVITFNGYLTSTVMGGTWKDIYGCSGRWWGVKD